MVSTIHPGIASFLKIFLVLLCEKWDLSSPTRDGTRTPYSGSVESKPLDCQGSSVSLSFFSLTSSLLLPGIINQRPTRTQGGSGGGGRKVKPASTVECCAELGSYLGDAYSAARPDWKSRELSAGERREQVRYLMQPNPHM